MSLNSRFTTLQPKNGETVLICWHIAQGRNSRPSHFYRLGEDGSDFTRPDGTRDRAGWAVVCNDCFGLFDPLSRIAGDRQWIGNEPAILKAPLQ